MENGLEKAIDKMPELFFLIVPENQPAIPYWSKLFEVDIEKISVAKSADHST